MQTVSGPAESLVYTVFLLLRVSHRSFSCAPCTPWYQFCHHAILRFMITLLLLIVHTRARALVGCIIILYTRVYNIRSGAARDKWRESSIQSVVRTPVFFYIYFISFLFHLKHINGGWLRGPFFKKKKKNDIIRSKGCARALVYVCVEYAPNYPRIYIIPARMCLSSRWGVFLDFFSSAAFCLPASEIDWNNVCRSRCAYAYMDKNIRRNSKTRWRLRIVET